MPQAGLGQVTGARPNPGDDGRLGAVGEGCLGYRCPMRFFGFVAHPLAVAADVFGELRLPGARSESIPQRRRGRPGVGPRTWAGSDERFIDQYRNRIPGPGGIVSRPSRCASKGKWVPPPANGSRIGGGLPSVDSRIFSCASRSSAPSLEFSHTTSRLIRACSFSSCGRGSGPPRWVQVGPRRRIVDKLRKQHRPGGGEGRRAHHRCSVDGCPCRDRLLPRRLGVDGLQRQTDLDQLSRTNMLCTARHGSPSRRPERLQTIAQQVVHNSPVGCRRWPVVSARRICSGGDSCGESLVDRSTQVSAGWNDCWMPRCAAVFGMTRSPSPTC